MRLIAIAAIDQAGAIGYQGSLPWPRLPKDMARFRYLSLGGDEGRGRPCLLGSSTYRSLGGRLLPGRHLIVLSRNPDLTAPGCHVARDIPHALAIASQWGDEAVVAGGAEVYAQLLPRCHRLYLTLVHGTFAADTFWPVPLDRLSEGWREVSREEIPADEKHAVGLTFLDMVKR